METEQFLKGVWDFKVGHFEVSFTSPEIMGTLVKELFYPEVNSDRFEITNRYEKSFRFHGNFTAANLEISNPSQKLLRLHGDFTAATF